ncbi:MAG: WecB/TagA/CpsF family glycosyltransferase [Oleispira sp.]|nr:WecB/TagA/CpsF family glycosyltransferase [Oleispira sp.]
MSNYKNEILSNLTVVEDVDKEIKSLLLVDKAVTVGFLNQHAYNLISGDSCVKEDFFSLDYLFRDGKGVELACKFSGISSGLNLNGTDFIPAFIKAVIDSSVDFSLFTYGTTSPWLEAGSSELFMGQAYMALNGFQEKEDYLNNFKLNYRTGSFNVIVLAMGMPKQELVARFLKNSINVPTIIICGGAIIDFQAGRISRAPAFVRRLGFEWFFRLILEPKRLFKRYVVGIPVFFYSVIKDRNQH